MSLDLEQSPETTEESAAPEEEKKKKKRVKIHGKLPEKRAINLATVNVKHINWALAIPLVLLILAASTAFAKFAVLDRMSAADRARSEVESLQRKLDEAYAAAEDYGDINDLYAHYTYSGMTDEEMTRANRVEMMAMLARVVLPLSPIDSWTVSGNELVLNISGRTLLEINQIVQHLLEDDMVEFCTVNTAATRQGGAADAAPGDTVNANVYVRLMPRGVGE